MQSENKAKTLALKSVMSNPKLSKILEDGFSAPIGSTKRSQASSIVSILTKISSRDGQGGPGNISMVPKKKTPLSPYSSIYKNVFDGQGGPADAPVNSFSTPSILNRAPEPVGGFNLTAFGDDKTYSSPPSATDFSYDNLTKTKPYTGSVREGLLPFLARTAPGALASVNNAAGKYVVKPVFGTAAKIAASVPLGLGVAGETMMQNIRPFLFNGDLKNPGGTDSAKFLSQLWGSGANGPSSIVSRQEAPFSLESALNGSMAVPSTGATLSGTPTGSVTEGPAEGTPGTVVDVTGDTYTYINHDGTIHNGKIGDKYEDKTVAATPGGESSSGVSGESTGTTDTGAATSDNPFVGTPYEAQWATLPENIKKLLKQSLTAGQFATITMADKEALRSLFPGVPDDQLPTGVSLNGQIKDLKDRLNDEYGLDALANERMNLIKSGSTLTTDLTDYIRGRDTYIKSVDGMIDGVKNNMKTGLSDPASQAANKTYLDYLSVLKGRQNKRYIELLNSSITQHDAVMADITNQYNTTFQNYQNELATETALTTDRYNQMYNDLSALYTLVQNGPTMAREAAMQEEQLNAIRAKALTDELDNEKKLSAQDLFKETKEIQYRLLTDESANSPIATFKESPDPYDESLSLYDEAVAAVAKSGKNPESFLDIVRRGIAGSDVSTSKKLVDQFIAAGGDKVLFDAGYTGTPPSEQFKTLIKNKQGRTYASIISQDVPSYKKAITFLIKIKPADLAKNKDKFMKQGGDPAILQAIWDYYNKSIASYGPSAQTSEGRASIFKTFLSPTPGTDGAFALANQIAY